MLDLLHRWSALVLAGNTLRTWACALLVAALVTAMVALVRAGVRRYGNAAARTSTKLDDLLVDVAGRTRLFFGIALGILAGLAVVDLSPESESVVRRIIVAVCTFQGGLWGTTFVRAGIDRYVRQDDPLVGNATGVLSTIGLGLVWSLVALLFLANLGVDVTAAIAGLGVGGIAVALAVQNVLADLFASLSIVLDRPFVIGDTITVDELTGTVEHIGIKTTRVRSLSGEMLVFSNSDLLRSRIRNFRDVKERRSVMTLPVELTTPTATLKSIPEALRQAVAEQANTRFDRAHLVKLGDSSLQFELVWYFTGGDYTAFMDTQQGVWLGILARLAELRVSVAYPTAIRLQGTRQS